MNTDEIFYFGTDKLEITEKNHVVNLCFRHVLKNRCSGRSTYHKDDQGRNEQLDNSEMYIDSFLFLSTNISHSIEVYSCAY